MKPVLLKTQIGEILSTKVKKDTQNKINLWIKVNIRILGKISQIYNKTI